MVYINNDGSINEGSKPWGISKITDLFWGPINFAFAFLQSLINPAINRIEGSSYRVGGGSSYMPGSSSAPRRLSSRFQTSRFRTMSQIAPPPAPSCRSCMM